MDIQENIIGVYKITNTKSGRYYIGYSTNIKRRFYTHKYKLRSKCHDNIFLQRAYNVDGEDSFSYEIIHNCTTEDEAKEIELTYLSNINIREQLYNLNYNNSGGDLLKNHPNKQAIIEKIIKTSKEKIQKMTLEERKLKYGRIG
jgi:group I intron endonuclease